MNCGRWTRTAGIESSTCNEWPAAYSYSFVKKSAKTSQRDLNIAKQRLGNVLARMLESSKAKENNHGKDPEGNDN